MAASMRAYRAAHPYCEHSGCGRVMHSVDHITPLAEGGDRYSWSNYQGLCEPHHKDKTVRDAQRGKVRPR